jgi:hypothetical protein
MISRILGVLIVVVIVFGLLLLIIPGIGILFGVLLK